MEKPIAIIPARGGSRRIPGKNNRPFFGKPIIAYSIEAALQSRLFSEVIVSTDSEEIAATAFRFGASPYLRPAEFCLDEVGTQEVARQYLMTLSKPPLFACTIYATAPLMRVDDLKRGYRMMNTCDYHFVLAVQAEPLQDIGQFYWSWVHGLIRGDPLIGTRTGLVPIPPEHVCDINTPLDWVNAEDLYRKLLEKQQ